MTTTGHDVTTDDRDGGMPDSQIIAVLAAAASVVLGAPVAIHQVTMHGHDEAERWSRAGRKDIMLSHRLGPKR